MRKKAFTVTLSLIIMTAFMPFTVFAAGNDISDGYSVLFVNDNDQITYTGSKIKPEVVVISDDFWTGEADYLHTYEYYNSDSIPDSWRDTYTLPSNKYKVSYPDDCTNAGEKAITITGKGAYSGSFTASYYISPKELTLTETKNADKSVTLKADGSIKLTGADVWFYNEDYHLQSDEYTISNDSVTISADFLNSYVSSSLDHSIRITTDNFYGNGTVRSYNISGLACLGNIKKVYNGKQQTLKSSDLGVTDADLDKEYRVAYSKSSRKSIGKYAYTIEGTGDYVGSLTGSFEIIPKATSRITYAKKSGSNATVKWRKVANCSGYQVQLVRRSKDESDMASYDVYKSSIVKGKTKLSKTFKKAKKSKYSKVRVRSYKLVGGKKIYSKWKYKSF